jgi:hypothetical protein
MAWQYHGYDTMQAKHQNPVFYPWDCLAIRAASIFLNSDKVEMESRS